MLERNQATNAQGFTIIEVMLTLAIAGLIFAVIFIAYPQVVLTQRQNAMKDDTRKLLAAVNECIINANRRVDMCDEKDELNFPIDEFAYSEDYGFNGSGDTIFNTKGPIIRFGGRCVDGKSRSYSDGGNRPTSYTVSAWLDPNYQLFGGRGVGICLDNNTHYDPG